MTNAPPPAPDPGPKSPVVGLVLSVVGLCVPPLLLFTAAFGIYGYLRSKRDPAWAPRKPVTQMTMVVSLAGLAIFVGLFLPNVKTAQLRLKQRECRDTLITLAEAQQTFFQNHKRYSTSLSELAPKLGGESFIRLSAEGPPSRGDAAWSDEVVRLTHFDIGLRGECPVCTITMVCAVNLDSDPMLDVWTVATYERVGAGGVKVPGYIPWNETDDVVQ